MSPLTFIQYSYSFDVLARTSREKKEVKEMKIRKEVKLSLCADDMIVYTENPKDTIRKLLECISKFS